MVIKNQIINNPSPNRIINWATRDMTSLRSSGYRKNLAAVIIDRKVTSNEAS